MPRTPAQQYGYSASSQIIPVIGWIGGLLGLYSLYLLYTGLPVLMKSPPEKALGYTVVVIIVGIILALCVFYLTRALGFGFQPGMIRPM